MAIDFLKIKKKQQYLILILALVIIAILLVVWYSFFQKPSVVVVPIAEPSQSEFNINFKILRDNAVQGLNLFEKVGPFEGEIGRQNPFTPY